MYGFVVIHTGQYINKVGPPPAPIETLLLANEIPHPVDYHKESPLEGLGIWLMPSLNVGVSCFATFFDSGV